MLGLPAVVGAFAAYEMLGHSIWIHFAIFFGVASAERRIVVDTNQAREGNHPLS